MGPVELKPELTMEKREEADRQKEIISAFGHVVMHLVKQEKYKPEEILTASVVVVAHLANDCFNGDYRKGQSFRKRMGAIFWDAYHNWSKVLGRVTANPKRKRQYLH